MNKNMFIGLIGIIAFLFASAAMMAVMVNNLFRYYVFDAFGGTFYPNINLDIFLPTIIFAIVNYAIAIGAGRLIFREDSQYE